MILDPWPLTSSEQEDLFRTLRFDYFKWDVQACGRRLVLPTSIVLTPQEHRDAVHITERFGDILTRLETSLLQRPDLLQRLGIPPDVIPLLTREQPTSLQLARYDLFLTPDRRWMVSEFNEDVPGGFNEAVGIPDLLGPRLHSTAFHGDLRASLLQALRPYPHIAFLYATGYSEDLQHMLVVRQWLEAQGHQTTLASPAHLTCSWRTPRIFGNPVHAAFRFYPAEWYQYLANRHAWMRALPRLPLMNPLRRLIRQSKRLYALWRDPSLLPPQDLDFLRDHTPQTLPYDALGNNGHSPRRDQLLDQRHRWVLKHAFGRMGDTVIMGNLVPETEWTAALAEADRAPGQWILQERFDVHPLPDPADGPLLYPALGVYLVNHRFAGYYSRAAHHPFINHEAYHVATLVQTP